MAGCQRAAPGAECRVGKCPSSGPPWRVPVHTGLPPSQEPLLLLTYLSCHSMPPTRNCSHFLSQSKTTRHQTNIVSVEWYVVHAPPPLSLSPSLYDECSFTLAHVCCDSDSVKGTGRKGHASSDAPVAVD